MQELIIKDMIIMLHIEMNCLTNISATPKRKIEVLHDTGHQCPGLQEMEECYWRKLLIVVSLYLHQTLKKIDNQPKHAIGFDAQKIEKATNTTVLIPSRA